MFYACTRPRYQVSIHRTIGPLGLIFAGNIDFGFSLELPKRGCSNMYTQSMFEQN